MEKLVTSVDLIFLVMPQTEEFKLEEKRHRVAEAVAKAKEISKQKELEEEELKKREI